MDKTTGFAEFEDKWQANARLALDTFALRPTQGIPLSSMNVMQWSHLETLSGNPPGSYAKEPVRVYREFQLKVGTCFTAPIFAAPGRDRLCGLGVGVLLLVFPTRGCAGDNF